MITKNEKVAIVKAMNADELLQYLTRYAQYSDVIANTDTDKCETYEIIYNEIKERIINK